MAEVKFRLWDKVNHRMIDPKNWSHAIAGGINILYSFPNDKSEWIERVIQEFKMMKFTGYLDKNEKEIFEGDIIETKKAETVYKHVIKRDNLKEFGFEPLPSSVTRINHHEIVGNIFECEGSIESSCSS